MGTLQVGGTTLGVKNTVTNKVDLSNVGDINVSGDIKNSGLEYLCARFPLGDDTDTILASYDPTDTSRVEYQSNVLSWTHSQDSSNPESADFTITGLTAGIWYIHATFGFDRTYTTSSHNITLRIHEDSTIIWEGMGFTSSGKNESISTSLVRNYTSTPPTLKIEFECDATNYLRKHGNCITIYRLG